MAVDHVHHTSVDKISQHYPIDTIAQMDQQLAEAEQERQESGGSARNDTNMYHAPTFQAALAFYGLPDTWARTFKKHLWTDTDGKQHEGLRSCEASKAGNAAVWTQINAPFDGTAMKTGSSKSGSPYSFPKKAQNSEIQFIRNVTLDFEYPPEPSIAHAIAQKLLRFLIDQGLAEEDHPIEDSGAGAHIGLPIVAIEIPAGSPKEISTRWNGAISRVVRKCIEPAFDRLCHDAGIIMDLEAFDISRILSLPGTWRPHNPAKSDCDHLRDGYLRRWLAPYINKSHPVRHENAKLTQLIQEAFVELQEEIQTTVKKGKEHLKSHIHASPNDLSDDALIQRMMAWENGDTFASLWYGGTGGYTNQSAADLALCNILAAGTGKDASRMDKLFRQSSLMRDKWDRDARTGETYGEGTIRVAIEGCNFSYDPNYAVKQSFEEANMDYQAKFADQAEETAIPSEEEPKLSSFDQVKLLLSLAIEQAKTDQVYALADMICLLNAIEQASIESIIKRNTKVLHGFSITSYKKCLKEAEANRKQKQREEREKDRPHYDDAPYFKDKSGMWIEVEPTERNPDPDPIKISNFTAEITTDVTTDDGAEKKRSYELEANLHGRIFKFEVPVEQFTRGEWVDKHIGARAAVTVGRQMKEHLAAAIKHCSDPQEQTYHAYTGWCKSSGRQVFLHNGGCLSEVSDVTFEEKNHITHQKFSSASAYRATLDRDKFVVSDVSDVSDVNTRVSVKLQVSLAKYEFPRAIDNIQQAIRASLAFVDITHDTIAMPLYAALWRAPLGEIDFGVHLAGQTGQGKSQMAALIQQHFGASMDASHLPAAWEDTVNALEMKLFQGKDVILVCDELKPKGGKSEQDKLYAKVDRIFRQIGNHSARGRLDGNLQLRAERAPRCLLISTGEDVTRGQSCNARLIAVTMTESVTKGDAAKRLTLAQKDARDGLYAQAMAGYIKWLAPQIEAIQLDLPSLLAEERNQLSIEGHARAGTNTANLILGMKYFLQYACDMEAITPQEAEVYLVRCQEALARIARDASMEDQQMKPSEQWLRLLSSAIAGNNAHLVTADGNNPGPGYGWKKSIKSYKHADGSETIADETYSGGGQQLGWIEGDNIYLYPGAAYASIVAEGNRTHDYVTTSQNMLNKLLAKDNVLASTDLHRDRATVAVRRRFQGSQPYVLHINVSKLFLQAPPAESHHSHHSHHSAASEPASEEPSGVSDVIDSEAGECSELHHSEQNPSPTMPPDRACLRCGKRDWHWDILIENYTCGGCNHG